MQHKSKVLDIVNSDSDRKIIIVSAPGKRHKDDVKTTDLLVRLYEKVMNNLNYQDKRKKLFNVMQIFYMILIWMIHY